MRIFLSLVALSVCLSALGGPVAATEFVKVKGKMSDRDFYRAVSCAAMPGGECQRRQVKWSEKKQGALTVGVWRLDDGYPAKARKLAWAALKNAIEEVNGVGSGIQLRLVTEGNPDIKVILIESAIADEAPTNGSVKDFALRGSAGGMATVYTSQRSPIIQEAEVMLTADLPNKYIKSVMLEEVVQTLGLLTDIHSRYYQRRSIFSEIGSDVTRLKGQDAKALLLHYPPQ